MLVTKRNKKGNPQLKTTDLAENKQPSVKEGGIPMGVKAILASAKKSPSVSANIKGDAGAISAKDVESVSHPTAKEMDYSDAYLQRMKKRMEKK